MKFDGHICIYRKLIVTGHERELTRGTCYLTSGAGVWALGGDLTGALRGVD